LIAVQEPPIGRLFFRIRLKALSSAAASQQIAREKIAVMKNPGTADGSHDPEELCSLERKCLALAAEGRNTKEIAAQVAISASEARILLYCAQRKLGASNRMQAVARYLADEMAAIMKT
jgi:DNA-binding CsgD family transcriptional regulator